MEPEKKVNNFTSDPYNEGLSRTVITGNNSLDFGDLKSGGSFNDSDKGKLSSPRSPTGRTDKKRSELL